MEHPGDGVEGLTPQRSSASAAASPQSGAASQAILSLPQQPDPYRPAPIQVPDKAPPEYVFPRHKLRLVVNDPQKTPLVIVACGSFSPITYLHLRMFEMARDYIVDNTSYEIIGGYFSPVSDAYNKIGLAPAPHRVTMCELATADSDWLMVDRWEPAQRVFVRTAKVLDHFEDELNGGAAGGCLAADGERRRIKLLLLAGGDLIESFAVPNLWAARDLHIILGGYGCIIIERTGSNVSDFMLQHDILHYHRKNVLLIKQYIFNDISSTKVRLFAKRGMSIRYLLPAPCVDYILTHRLYVDDGPSGPGGSGPGAAPGPVRGGAANLSRRKSALSHSVMTPSPQQQARTALGALSLSSSSTVAPQHHFLSSTASDMVTVHLAQVTPVDVSACQSPVSGML